MMQYEYSARITGDTDAPPKLLEWLAAQANGHKYLLAHAEDGLIWGRFVQGQLTLAHQHFAAVSPVLEDVTLWQCYCFGPDRETLLWRDGNQWHSRRIEDEHAPGALAFDEEQMLWGTDVEEVRDGFALVRDGSEGLRHAVPCAIISDSFSRQARPLRLVVRHYVQEDPETGVARVTLSRLVDLKIV